MNKNTNQKFPFRAFETYCTRTPLLSFDFYLNLVSSQEITDQKLIQQFLIPIVNEAIYLASPELYSQLVKWKNNEIDDKKKVKRLRISLLKYLTRISTRCTPFGLFASVGTGQIGKTTKIELANNISRKSHYDMNFLVEYAVELAKKPIVRKQILFFPNTSLYRIGSRYRYIEYKYQDKQRIYSLESISHSSYLEAILKGAKSGITTEAILKLLQSFNVSLNEAEDFIEELIINQILISELEPSLTGIDFLEDIKTRLLNLNNTHKELSKIEALQLLIKKIDSETGRLPSNYSETVTEIKQLQIPFSSKYLIQTDAFSKYKNNSISYRNIKKICQGIAFLKKISPSSNNINLERFKSDFIKRYDFTRVPLSKVLDVETGIGYIQTPSSIETTPFLSDILFEVKNEKEYEEAVTVSLLQKVLLRKIGVALAKNEYTVELVEEDFPNTQYDWHNAPDTLYVLAEIVKEEDEEKVFMDYCGAQAARLISRFGHGHTLIEDLIEEIADKESEMNPDYIIAEIVHLPESRIGNILRRPQTRQYEIPYLAKSNLPIYRQIQIEDIDVVVEQDTIKLFQKNTRKRIIPSSTNAHNYAKNSLPIYHFLCDLQTQEKKGFGFNWTSIFEPYTFLPRVVYKDCIFSKAKWRFSVNDIPFLSFKESEKQEFLESAYLWRKKNKIPDFVKLLDNDNTLVINFNNYNSIEMFVQIVKQTKSFTLEEFSERSKSIITMGEDNYCNQFVFSFYNELMLKNVKRG